MSLEIILSQFEDIKEAIVIVKNRIDGIESPLDFFKDEKSIIVYDSIAMRLQTIGESIKNVDKRNKTFLSKETKYEKWNTQNIFFDCPFAVYFLTPYGFCKTGTTKRPTGTRC